MKHNAFKFHVQNLSYGWCQILMLINDKKVWYNASYLGDNPLETMIEACTELMKENGPYYISWEREPGVLNIELNHIDDMLQIDLFDEKVYYCEEAKEEKVVEKKVHEVVPFKDFVSAIISEGFRVLNAFGLYGYRQSWLNHTDFPLTNLLRLTGKCGEIWKGDSCCTDISKEMAVLQEYIAKLDITEETKMDSCTIYYESWQIQCCGEPFFVGGKVKWTCIMSSGYKNAHGIILDFDEDHHGFATHSIEGVVTKIIAERSEFPKGKREVWYEKAETIREDLQHADGWESDKPDDDTTERTFWGYIVELKDVTIIPLKNTSTFEFKVANGMDNPAIWFFFKEKEEMVFPLALYNTLWDCHKERDFGRNIKASFQIFKDEVSGSFHEASCGDYHIDFERDSFLESAQLSLKQLCGAVISGEQTAYDNFSTKMAEQMLIGLNQLNIPKNYFQIFDNEIIVEHFSFEFVEPYNCDTNYVIKIGNREYLSCLSDWTTDFNRIRLAMEVFVSSLWSSTEIELYFEDSPTSIQMRNGTSSNSNTLTRVTIIPNDFTKAPNIYGWCNKRQLMSSLYLGFLGISIKESNWFDGENVGNWSDFRLATYNKLQSCVIENFIKGVGEDEQTHLPRQRIINSVEDMMLDYQNLRETLIM